MLENATRVATTAETAIAARKPTMTLSVDRGGGEPDHRREQDAAVEREVDDAGLLGDRLADDGVDQRGGGGDDAGEYFHVSPARVRRRATVERVAPGTGVRRACQPPTSRMNSTSMPCMTPASDESMSSRSDSWVLPTSTAAKKRAIGAVHTARNPASSTTRMARKP